MSFLKDFLTYSKKERGGIIALFLLMILSAFIYFIIDCFPPERKYDYSKFKAEIEAFESEDNRAPQNKKNIPTFVKNNYSRKSKTNSTLFYFDPNTLSKDSLILLGIYPKIAERIDKFRNAGGKFNSSSDLKKIYGLSDKMYSKLEPFVRISENHSSHSSIQNQKTEKLSSKSKIININTADTAELMSLKGIGPKLSARIIKFRENAGGFYDISQLLDVYGIKTEVFEDLKSKISTDENVKKININTATSEDLKKHPYIYKWNIANAIVNYRVKHGKYQQASDLMKTDLVSEDLCRKIAPYLIFE